MRLTRKLVLALLFGVFSVVFVFSLFRIRREVALLDADMRRDHRMIGLTAAAAVAKAQSTWHEAAEIVRRVDASRENMTIRFVSLAEPIAPQTAPLVHLAPAERPAPGRWVHLVRDVERASRTEPSVVTYVAAPVSGLPAGAIQLVEPLAARADYVRQSVVGVVVSSVAMVLVCGAIAVFIGARLVGRPVSKLIAAARKIGAGDFDVEIQLKQKDELGELGLAIEAMSMRLAEARRTMKEEADARIRALEQLRHTERLATLGQLASVLAHEVGTPLNVISGHAKMIATGRTSRELLQEAAQTIGAQCDRMTQIVRRILDYARRKRARRALLPADEVVLSAVEMLAPLAKQRAVEIRYSSRPAGIQIFADASQIAQAITNVLLNAIQASPRDTAVEVTVQREAGADADAVVITVDDAGPGIPEQIRSQIFEPFFTTKPPGEGTGLGLSIMRDIVEEHGGWARVNDRSGDGTSVALYFPQPGEPCPAES